MPALEPCPFCRPDPALSLWESEHYRVLADAFPRCAGHVLLVTKDHLASHMHAPAARLDELEAAQAHVRQFLLDTFGRATFLENGGRRQEVPHAHLHAVPFTAQVPAEWLRTGLLREAAGWPAVWRVGQREGAYVLLETLGKRYVLANDADYGRMLYAIRRQIVTQTPAEIDPAVGELLRGGPGMVAQTVALWRAWAPS